ncbi:MAG: hypothetical protein ACMXYG_02210 [Candidatus Woesearchaeota archaeon]
MSEIYENIVGSYSGKDDLHLSPEFLDDFIPWVVFEAVSGRKDVLQILSDFGEENVLPYAKEFSALPGYSNITGLFGKKPEIKKFKKTSSSSKLEDKSSLEILLDKLRYEDAKETTYQQILKFDYRERLSQIAEYIGFSDEARHFPTSRSAHIIADEYFKNPNFEFNHYVIRLLFENSSIQKEVILGLSNPLFRDHISSLIIEKADNKSIWHNLEELLQNKNVSPIVENLFIQSPSTMHKLEVLKSILTTDRYQFAIDVLANAEYSSHTAGLLIRDLRDEKRRKGILEVISKQNTNPVIIETMYKQLSQEYGAFVAEAFKLISPNDKVIKRLSELKKDYSKKGGHYTKTSMIIADILSYYSFQSLKR